MTISISDDWTSIDFDYSGIKTTWKSLHQRYEDLTPILKANLEEIENSRLEQKGPYWGVNQVLKTVLTIILITLDVITRMLSPTAIGIMTGNETLTVLGFVGGVIWSSLSYSGFFGMPSLLVFLEEKKLLPGDSLQELQNNFKATKENIETDLNLFISRLTEVSAYFIGEPSLVPEHLKNVTARFYETGKPILEQAKQLSQKIREEFAPILF